MSLSAAVIDALVANGVTVEQLAAAVKADLAEGDARVQIKREKDAARQRKSRASRSVTVTPCDTKDAPPNESISNPPPPSETKVSSVGKRGRAHPIFELPSWVPVEPWAAFEKMRKGMRAPFGDDAKRGIVGDLDRLRGEGHDPAKLLLKAVKLGWRGVFAGDDTRTGKTVNGNRPMNADEIRAGIRFAEDRDDLDRAAELKRQYAALTAKPPDPKIARLVHDATSKLRA